MSRVADRFRRVAADFGAVVDAVDGAAWSNRAPCEGWVARDVVGHLVEWIPGPGFLLGSFDIPVRELPSVAEDPSAAWNEVAAVVQAGLDDPAVASRTADCGPLGQLSFETAIERTVLNDVLVHTWDLAQAAGVDVALDPDELGRQREAIAAISPALDAAMRDSGHFGPRVSVEADADDLTAVLAFYGREAH